MPEKRKHVLANDITIWVKPSCVQCDATKRALNKHGITYTVRDLTTNPGQVEAFKNAGYATAPIVVTPHNTWAGFRPDLIKQLKEHA